MVKHVVNIVVEMCSSIEIPQVYFDRTGVHLNTYDQTHLTYSYRNTRNSNGECFDRYTIGECSDSVGECSNK